MLLITHDLGVVAAMASRVVVMYAGQVVEEAPARELFRDAAAPVHAAAAGAWCPGVREKRARLSAIAGSIPAPSALPVGCRFHPRCPDAIPLCREAAPHARARTAPTAASAAGAPPSSPTGSDVDFAIQLTEAAGRAWLSRWEVKS